MGRRGASARLPRRRPASRAVLARGVLDGLLGYHLRRAQVAVFQDFGAAMAGIDITPGQFGVMALIQANVDLSQSALGQAMGVDRSTVVAVIDRLEARNLVERAPSLTDRRSYALRLTGEGERRFAQALKRINAHERRIARRLNARDRAQLMAWLLQIG